MNTNLIKITDKLEIEEILYKGKRVLTSKQLAEVYECNEKQIRQNFNNNKNKFVEGKHYIKLIGDDLKRFVEFFDKANKFSPTLLLWYEEGAVLMARTINTDTAWKVSSKLVDFYFQHKQIETTNPYDLLVEQAIRLRDQQRKLEKIENDVNSLKKIQEDAENSFKELPLSESDANELSTRSKINLIIRTFSQTKGFSIQDAWKHLYTQFKYRYSFDVYARERNKDYKLSKLEIIERQNKIEDLYDLASELFNI